MKTILRAIKTILIPVLTGLLAGLIISDSTDLYRVLIKPPFSLPGGLFSVVWILLYITIGIALYLFENTVSTDKIQSDGTLYFYIQLFLNFLWPIVFFRLKLPLAAFIVLVLLFIFAAITATKFYQVNKASGILFIPYLLYILYAGYLNFAIWYLNM